MSDNPKDDKTAPLPAAVPSTATSPVVAAAPRLGTTPIAQPTTGSNVRYQKDGRDALVFHPGDFGALENIARVISPEVKITADCADGIQRDFPSAGALEAYPNLKSSRLLSVTFSASAYEREQGRHRSISLRIGHKYLTSWGLSIESTEADVAAARDAFLAQLESLQPWFWPFVWLKFVHVLFVAGILMSLAAIAAEIYLLLLGRVGGSGGSAADTGNVWSIAILAVVLCMGLDSVKEKVFPSITFATGAGRSRYSRQDMLRALVLVGGVLGVATSLIASGLYELLMGLLR